MIKTIIKIISYLLLVLLLMFGGFYLYLQNHLQSEVNVSKLLFIPAGSTKSVINYLDTQGIKMYFFDYYILKRYGYPQAGWINIGEERLSRDAFYYKITHSKAALNTITLIPGETKELFFDEIAKQLDLNHTKLLQNYEKLAPSPDGVIIADTYKIPKGSDEATLMDYLISTSLKKHQNIAAMLQVDYNQTGWFTDTITKASIITKEAADIEEMPQVSAVIRNRLQKNMPLQMDGTLNYKYQSHQKVTPALIRSDDSAFNTYKNPGLPPHPICAVTKDAIEAALNPSDVKYLYFVRGKNGKHHFTNSYKEHLKAIKQSNSVK